MKVLYLVPILPPHTGGAASCFGLIIQEAGRLFSGKDDRVVCLTERGAVNNYPPSVEVRDTLCTYDSVPAAERNGFKQLINYFIIGGHIIFGRYDVVHIHARYVYSRKIGFLIWHLLALFQKKVIVDIRDRFYNNRPNKHRYLVCAEALGKYYAWIPEKTFIPIPLRPAKPATERTPDHRVAYFGAIVENKGIWKLIDGYEAYQKKSGNPLGLDIWGSNVIGEAFLKRIAEFPKITYRGICPADMVLGQMKEYKAIILPSQSEGFPRICLEGMYADRIVVMHKSVEDLIPYLPQKYILGDDVATDICGVLHEIEKQDGMLKYDYDFSKHFPSVIMVKLAEIYKT